VFFETKVVFTPQFFLWRILIFKNLYRFLVNFKSKGLLALDFDQRRFAKKR
jgi:hypothetical protein